MPAQGERSVLYSAKWRGEESDVHRKHRALDLMPSAGHCERETRRITSTDCCRLPMLSYDIGSREPSVSQPRCQAGGFKSGRKCPAVAAKSQQAIPP